MRSDFGVMMVIRIGLGLLLLFGGGCATVRPEQRAILADPVMRFQREPGEEEATQHALENREGSYGGGTVQGGGCGCN
jgi:hypothetical protein